MKKNDFFWFSINASGTFFTLSKKCYLFYKHTITRLIAFSFTFLSAVIFPNLLRSQQQQPYNVLFVVIDDMNDRINFLGLPEAAAPNLQRLLNRGMSFTRAYAQYALCNPSRTSFLSGWRPDKTGIFDNVTRPSTVISSNVKYLPEYFEQNGYNTERYGKIMHGRFENDITWDYAEPPESSSESKSMQPAAQLDPPGTYWVQDLVDSNTVDGGTALDLVNRLKQPKTKPFFYALGLIGPHDFFIPTRKYWNMNGDSSVQELLPIDSSGNTRANFTGNGSANINLPSTPAGDRSDVPTIAFPPKQTNVKSTYEWQKTIHAYDGEVSQMDAQLGLVLDEFDRQDLWSNTIVIFFSDHGQHLGEHEGLWQKQTLFEEALHVPLIVCVPGKPAGVCNRLIEMADIYPTLLELCTLPPVSGLEGSSFVRLLDDSTLPWKTAAFSQVFRSGPRVMGRTIRTEQYRYTSWDTAGEELYDHNADPHEYTNLVSNSSYTDVLTNMRQILTDGWIKAVPPVCTSQTYYKDSDSDGYGNISDSVTACYQPRGYSTNHTDCNDNDSTIHPGAIEICDGIDNDCNGLIDDVALLSKFYRDADSDGYGNNNDTIRACIAPVGYVNIGNDCNDSNATVHPGATDICDGIDNNCDGIIDENKIIPSVSPSGFVKICTGNSVLLTASGGSGITYQWLKNNVNIIGATSQTYFTNQPANYKVHETNNFSCANNSVNSTVQFTAPPPANITASGNLNICSTHSVLLKASTGAGFTYQWFKDGINIANTGSSISVTSPGTYKVTITNSYGCSKTSADKIVTGCTPFFAQYAVIRLCFSRFSKFHFVVS